MKPPGIIQTRSLSVRRAVRWFHGAAIAVASLFWSSVCSAVEAGAAESAPIELHAVKPDEIGCSVAHWTVEEGLPGRAVSSLAQTPDGYLWCGTYSGLARYDGHEFELFDSLNTPALESVRVEELRCDASGRLWIEGTSGELIVLENGRFRRLTEVDGVPPRQAGKLGGDPRGDLWFKGRSDDRFYHFRNGGFEPVSARFPGSRVDRFLADRSGLTWGVHKFNRTMLHFQSDPAPEQIPNARESEADATLGRFFQLQDDRLAVTSSKGIYVWQDSRWVMYRVAEPVINSPALDGVEDWEGNLWVSYVDVGLVCHEASGRSVRVLLPELPVEPSLPSLLLDSEGNVWVASDAGLYQIRRETFRTQPMLTQIEGRTATSIVEDTNAGLWVLHKHGVARMRGGEWEFLPNPNTNEVVGAGAPAHDGGLFLSFANSQRSEIHLEKIGADGKREQLGTVNAYIHAILELLPGELLLGTETGLWRWQHGEFKPESISGTTGEYAVYALVQDKRGRLIVSALGQGLFMRELNGHWERIGTTNDPGNTLVVSVYPDDDTLWVATDRGLVCWKDGLWFNYGTRNGALPGWVRGIAGDDLGGLWIASQFGVTRVERERLNALADGSDVTPNSAWFDRSDGLPSVACAVNQRSILKSADGRIWVATARGAAASDPTVWKRKRERLKAPPVHIHSVIIDDRTRKTVSQQGTQRIVVPSGTTRVELAYSAIDFTPSHKNRFRYRLEGCDHSWVDAGDIRSVAYYHLPLGELRFQVTAVNKNGIWNESGASLELLVLPAWWQRVWVQMLGGFLFLGSGICIYALRVRQLQRKAAAREAFAQGLIAAQEAERKRLAGELHDDLGQDLLVIKSQLDSQRTESPPGQVLSELADSVKHAIHKLRAISHGLRPLHLERLGFSSCVRSMVDEISKATRMHFETEIDDVKGMLTADAEIGLYRILQEALNNVVKHSDASEARVMLKRLPDSVLLSVSDDGKGFDVAQLESSEHSPGHGLEGMRERCQLLGGRLRVVSAPENGTTVRVELPLADAATAKQDP